jgi:hypothetical protein
MAWLKNVIAGGFLLAAFYEDAPSLLAVAFVIYLWGK